MYTCGPTVYDFAHIGNFRAFLFADVLRRYLEFRGAHVDYVMNMTDVGHMTDDSHADAQGEDKMAVAQQNASRNQKAGQGRRRGRGVENPDDPFAVAQYFVDAFLEDARITASSFRSRQRLRRRPRYFSLQPSARNSPALKGLHHAPPHPASSPPSFT